MRTRYEPDEWTEDGSKILSPENLSAIDQVLKRGPIIVQHWFYRGASCPRLACFDDMEDFEEYLKENAVPGDAFDVWAFNDLCNSSNRIAEGKLPDQDGTVPRYGAY